MDIKLIDIDRNGIETYLLTNDNNCSAEIVTYGARIKKLCVPDKNGKPVDVVAGFDTASGFAENDNPYFNAVIGRVANRIGGAKFELDGKTFDLCKNDGNNHLHGGKIGFDKRIWKASVVKNGDTPKLELRLHSPALDEGYPSALDVKVVYTLTSDNALNIAYYAVCDGDTPVNLTNHAYFNLSGNFENDVLDHVVYIASNKMTAVDNKLIPHGEIADVTNGACDFSTPKTIGRDIKADDKYIKIAGGYDFNYVLDNAPTDPAATAYCQKSGIRMEVITSSPCMQFYTGNFLDGVKGKQIYNKHSAFCMETQYYPNAVNVQSFPSIVLKSGDVYETKTSYRFKVQ